MLVVRQNQIVPFDRNSVVTVGSFDGVHLAHQALIVEIVNRARGRGGRSVVLTFDPHPKQVLGGREHTIQLLTTLEERQALCEELGVDVFYVVPFTYEFSRQTSKQFYETYVLSKVGVSEVVEGYDHHFGRDREGSVEELVRLGKEFGFTVTAMKPVSVGSEVVSSTAIRKHLLRGDVERAYALLGRPYAFRGTVQRGDGRGKNLGFPTANLRPSVPLKILPGDGIYFVQVNLENDSRYGLASMGVRPTFQSGGVRTLEVYLFNFDGDLYGKALDLRFLRRLRDEKQFATVEDLVRQMNEDREEGLKLIQEYETTLRVSAARLTRKS
ncbi:MAG: bifunctional riboflavin kinase/FAD synthetase [Ignavibacteriales bacterium]|nr:bifunctional riboflavin kinase/FAD synthetase [Ignavibacteriales bacterium]